jgi:hypothetical protein
MLFKFLFKSMMRSYKKEEVLMFVMGNFWRLTPLMLFGSRQRATGTNNFVIENQS